MITVGSPLPDLAITLVDANNALVDATVLLTITLPTSTSATPTVNHDGLGLYSADYITAAPGRHLAVWTASGTVAATFTQTFDVTSAISSFPPTLAEIREYLGDTSASDETLEKVLSAEMAAQAARCRIDNYGPDLAEALLRRVARNLAARTVPLTTYSSFETGGTTTRLPRTDAEIQRLEAPYRRLRVG